MIFLKNQIYLVISILKMIKCRLQGQFILVFFSKMGIFDVNFEKNVFFYDFVKIGQKMTFFWLF